MMFLRRHFLFPGLNSRIETQNEEIVFFFIEPNNFSERHGCSDSPVLGFPCKANLRQEIDEVHSSAPKKRPQLPVFRDHYVRIYRGFLTVVEGLGVRVGELIGMMGWETPAA
nr:hypothetical protein Iba_chr05dCG8350 [Ipomoea batatas]